MQGAAQAHIADALEGLMAVDPTSVLYPALLQKRAAATGYINPPHLHFAPHPHRYPTRHFVGGREKLSYSLPVTQLVFTPTG